MSRGVRRYALFGVEQVEGVQSHGALAWFVTAYNYPAKAIGVSVGSPQPPFDMTHVASIRIRLSSVLLLLLCWSSLPIHVS